MTLQEKMLEASERLEHGAQSTEQSTEQAKELDFYANLDEYLTPGEVANILKVSSSYLAQLRLDNYNKDKDGNLRADFLPFFKAGKSVRYKKSDVLEWIERNTQRG